MPKLAEECIASWRKHMPDWEYRRWDEANFDIASAPLYVRQAYEAKKFAFVSDYVRLWALEQYGGLYMDVDFKVYRPFDELMDKYAAFAGYEGSKRQPVMMGVIASEPHGAWVSDMLSTYQFREFIKDDGNLDLTPNTSYFTDRLISQGFISDGVEKDFYLDENIENKENTACADKNIKNNNVIENTSDSSDSQKTVKNVYADGRAGVIVNSEKVKGKSEFYLHVFPVEYFCPVLTTGEDVRTEMTYCEHMGESSWAEQNWKGRVLQWLGPKWKTRIIKSKRRILG